GRLAAARGAEQGHELAGTYREVDVVADGEMAKGLAHAAQFDISGLNGGSLRGQARAHPFIMPSAKPRTIWSRKAIASRITGATLITAAAIISPNTVWYWPANWAMTSGTVWACWRVRIRAKKNSFQASTKAKTAAAPKGGIEIGSTICQKVRK